MSEGGGGLERLDVVVERKMLSGDRGVYKDWQTALGKLTETTVASTVGQRIVDRLKNKQDWDDISVYTTEDDGEVVVTDILMREEGLRVKMVMESTGETLTVADGLVVQKLLLGNDKGVVNFRDRIPSEVGLIYGDKGEKEESGYFHYSLKKKVVHCPKMETGFNIGDIWHEGGHAVRCHAMNETELGELYTARKLINLWSKTIRSLLIDEVDDRLKHAESSLGIKLEAARFLVNREEKWASRWGELDLTQLYPTLGLDGCLADKVKIGSEKGWQSYDVPLGPQNSLLSELAAEVVRQPSVRESVYRHLAIYGEVQDILIELLGMKAGSKMEKKYDTGRFRVSYEDSGEIWFQFFGEDKVQYTAVLDRKSFYVLTSSADGKQENSAYDLTDLTSLQNEATVKELLPLLCKFVVGTYDLLFDNEDEGWRKIELIKATFPDLVQYIDPTELLVRHSSKGVGGLGRSVYLEYLPPVRQAIFMTERLLDCFVIELPKEMQWVREANYHPDTGRKIRGVWDRMLIMAENYLLTEEAQAPCRFYKNGSEETLLASLKQVRDTKLAEMNITA